MTRTDASRRARTATVVLSIVIAAAGVFALWATDAIDPWLRWLGDALLPTCALVVVVWTLAHDAPDAPPWHEAQPDPPTDSQPDPLTARLERMVPARSGRSSTTTADWVRTLGPLLAHVGEERRIELMRPDHFWTRSDLDDVLKQVSRERPEAGGP